MDKNSKQFKPTSCKKAENNEKNHVTKKEDSNLVNLTTRSTGTQADDDKVANFKHNESLVRNTIKSSYFCLTIFYIITDRGYASFSHSSCNGGFGARQHVYRK